MSHLNFFPVLKETIGQRTAKQQNIKLELASLSKEPESTQLLQFISHVSFA